MDVASRSKRLHFEGMKATLTILLAFASLAVRADRFDDFVRTTMDEEKIPGLQFVVVYKGKVVMSRAYGLADVEAQKPVKTDSEFEIASISKPVIATAVMMLWEQGKFKLDEPVGKYVKDMPLAWSDVPIRALLSHTSGIPDFRGSEYYFRHRQEDTPFAEITKNMSTERQFDVGDHFAYSNTNYLMLGRLIEAISGKPYTEFLQSQIFDPLGMTATGFVGRKEHVPGYGLAGGKFYAARDCSLAWAGPGSSIVSTAEDVAKFDAALQDQKLIKNATLLEMLQPTPTKLGVMDYGLGWQTARVGKTLVMSHSGKMNGFSSVFLRLPVEKISVIVLTNAGDIDGNTVTRGILGLYFPEMDPQQLTPIVDDQPETTKAHLRILLGFMSGSTDMDAFSDEYKLHVTEDKLKAMGAELSRGGRPKPLQVLARFHKGAFDVHKYLLVQGQTQLIVTFFVDEKGKVGGLTITAP
jgi:CubicO group peptidase (beta-lactamase class C family)